MTKIQKILIAVLPPVLIILLGWLIYANVYQVPFVFDDLPYIRENPGLRNIRDIASIWRADSHPSRFVTFITFALNYHFHQYRLFGYHLVNILIHIGNALLVRWFVLLILSTPQGRGHMDERGQHVTAFVAALIFLTHPLQTQAVTYIVQRFASLSTFFYLGALCFYLKSRLIRHRQRSGIALAAAVLCGTLSMFSKEISFTLPLMILLMEIYFFQPKGVMTIKHLKKNPALMLLPLMIIVPLLFSFDFRAVLGHTQLSGSHEGDVINFGSYLITQFRVVVTYLRLFLIPIGQNLDYDYPLRSGMWVISFIFSLFLILTLIIAAVKLFSRQRLLSFGLAWFFLCLSVESSIIPIRHVIFEHRMYLPLIGLALITAACLQNNIRARRARIALVCLIIGILSVMTFARNKVWQSSIVLWRDCLAKSPQKPRPYLNLGVAYIEDQQYEKAIMMLNEALALKPDYFEVYNNRGSAYYRLGQYESALADYNRALEMRPSAVRVLNNRGAVYKAMGETDLAQADFDRAIDKYRAYSSAHFNKGTIYEQQKDYERAIESYNLALLTDPVYGQAYYHRGLCYFGLKDHDKALADFNRAISLEFDLYQVYNNRSILYGLKGQFDLALADLSRMIQLKPDAAESYANRGVIYRQMKRYDLALVDYNTALILKPDYPEVYYNRGGIYKLMSKHDLALEDFSTLIILVPKDARAYFQRAHIYLLRQDVSSAKSDYLSVLSFQPENAKAHNALGKIAYFDKRYKVALDYFNQAIMRDEGYAQAFYFRSLTYEALGNEVKALEDIIMARKLGLEVSGGTLPGFPEASDKNGNRGSHPENSVIDYQKLIEN